MRRVGVAAFPAGPIPRREPSKCPLRDAGGDRLEPGPRRSLSSCLQDTNDEIRARLVTSRGAPLAASRPQERPDALYRRWLFLLYAAGFAVVLAIAAHGADFYRTPLVERARHEGYWQWKAGGSIGHKLGVVGSSMMLLMLLYSVRKRAGFLRRAGTAQPLARRAHLPRRVRAAAGGAAQRLQGPGARGAELLVDGRRRVERRAGPLPLPADPAHARRGGDCPRRAREAGQRAVAAPARRLRTGRDGARADRRARRDAAARPGSSPASG